MYPGPQDLEAIVRKGVVERCVGGGPLRLEVRVADNSPRGKCRFICRLIL